MKFRVLWQIIFFLLSVGYMFIWVMLPTKTYKTSWTPKLNEKLNSTYFREQGTNLLLFSFPIMFIAALGCVYLHFQKKSSNSGRLKSIDDDSLKCFCINLENYLKHNMVFDIDESRCSRDSLVMICGGSGITPFISIIREIIFRSTQPEFNVPKILLVTAFKNPADLSMLDLLLPLYGNPIDISKVQLQIEAYITRENDQKSFENAHKLIQIKLFKPNPSDSPISSALGKNSWLLLGAIISSSFIMFLIFLGIVTRYHIYPVERRGQNYHYSFKILWDMFLVMACVFIGTSVIFLLQKRETSEEERQIQNVEMTSPTSSPASWLCATERELESLPHQSLVQCTKVHYGTRPDLKRILFDRKEPDVGVLVCGPKSMRHEVAKICASALAKNLHFESISFNW
ncbi:ferric reduction oxidase 5-like [Olea europaea var. sylvestris]|uniref:ferric reduction oxidase 5-like n=1 Tax=Olea europaea var. sylvestris TaxID=158386 RepID=UPI000C1D3312|nr:ferric reduction oxidase 5-like [Olea europaea var. sylvestris]